MFRFQDPYFLLFLLLIPLMFYFYLFKRKKIDSFIRYSSFHNLKKDRFVGAGLKKTGPLILRSIIITFIVFALARPQFGTKTTEIVSEGIDIMLAIDTSGSMKALDYKIDRERHDRLSVIKKIVNDFIKKRADDRLGMIVFGTDAYTQSPLTLDHGMLTTMLDKLSIGMAGESTAIGSAIGTAVKRLKDLKSKSKIIILLTDGDSNAGIDPIKASEIAKGYGIKIYTIGVGSKGKVPFEVQSFFGKTLQYADVSLDEALLNKISNITGGRYFLATNTDELIQIYETIDKLEKSEIKTKEYMDFNEKYFIWVLLALILLGFEIVLNNTFFRKLP